MSLGSAGGSEKERIKFLNNTVFFGGFYYFLISFHFRRGG